MVLAISTLFLSFSEQCEDLCPDTFSLYPNARCILYDDEKCNGAEGMKQMGNGDDITNIEMRYSFDVESISIKRGCEMTIFSGNFVFDCANKTKLKLIECI